MTHDSTMIMPPAKASKKNLEKQEKTTQYQHCSKKKSNKFGGNGEKDRACYLRRASICKNNPSNSLEKTKTPKNEGTHGGEGKKNLKNVVILKQGRKNRSFGPKTTLYREGRVHTNSDTMLG